MNQRMSLPWFTEKDIELSKADGIRDPMGRLGVWRTGVGRMLVPNIASPVNRVYGILAVIFIYRIIEIAASQGRNWGFVKLFRLLEGTIEYYLSQNESKSIIYGQQALGDPLLFTIATTDTRTVCNGLRQYYRGTCKRAQLVNNRLTGLTDEARNKCEEIVSAREIAALPIWNALDKCIKNDKRIHPGETLIEPATKKVFDRHFDLLYWKEWLKEPVLGTRSEYFEFARLCSEHRLNGNQLKTTTEAMKIELVDTIDRDITIKRVLDTIEKCERFICWVCYTHEWLLQCDRKSLEYVANNLNEVHSELKNAAADFYKIDRSYWTSRFEQYRVLAEAASRSTKDFIAANLNLHEEIMKERGLQPLVMEEKQYETICVVNPIIYDWTPKKIADRVADGYWLNDYYMSAVGSIYNQLWN